MRTLMSTMAGALFLFVVYATADAVGGPEYVGNEGCKCHKQEMADWAKSPHGLAFDQLFANKRSRSQNKAMKNAGLDYKADYDKDPKCLACHTVGYGKPGGYAADNMKEDLMGAGCESCHGPGSLYRVLHKEKEETFTVAEAAALGEVYPPDEKTCRACHDNPDSVFSSKTDADYAFNFKERIEEKKSWHKKYDLLYKH